jgi:hypothetical protein
MRRRKLMAAVGLGVGSLLEISSGSQSAHQALRT